MKIIRSNIDPDPIKRNCHQATTGHIGKSCYFWVPRVFLRRQVYLGVRTQSRQEILEDAALNIHGVVRRFRFPAYSYQRSNSIICPSRLTKYIEENQSMIAGVVVLRDHSEAWVACKCLCKTPVVHVTGKHTHSGTYQCRTE